MVNNKLLRIPAHSFSRSVPRLDTAAPQQPHSSEIMCYLTSQLWMMRGPMGDKVRWESGSARFRALQGQTHRRTLCGFLNCTLSSLKKLLYTTNNLKKNEEVKEAVHT